MASDEQLLRTLADDEGFTDADAMVERFALSSVVPGICRVCTFTVSRLEPDQAEGWCPECDTPTCASVLVLAGWA